MRPVSHAARVKVRLFNLWKSWNRITFGFLGPSCCSKSHGNARTSRSLGRLRVSTFFTQLVIINEWNRKSVWVFGMQTKISLITLCQGAWPTRVWSTHQCEGVTTVLNYVYKQPYKRNWRIRKRNILSASCAIITRIALQTRVYGKRLDSTAENTRAICCPAVSQTGNRTKDSITKYCMHGVKILHTCSIIDMRVRMKEVSGGTFNKSSIELQLSINCLEYIAISKKVVIVSSRYWNGKELWV